MEVLAFLMISSVMETQTVLMDPMSYLRIAVALAQVVHLV
jgi:hypothetical protein